MTATGKKHPVAEPPIARQQLSRRAAGARKKNQPTPATATTTNKQPARHNLAPRKTAPRPRPDRATTAEADNEDDENEDEDEDDTETTPKAKRVQHRGEMTATEVESNDDEDAESGPGARTVQPEPAIRGSETEKVCDTKANDSSSSSSDGDSTAVARLSTPKKRKNVQAQNEQRRKRQGTVIDETDYELPALRRLGSSRSPEKNSRIYGRQGRTDKGKGKAVEAEASESDGDLTQTGRLAQAANAADEQDLGTLTGSPRRPTTSISRGLGGSSGRVEQSESPVRSRAAIKSPRSPAQRAPSRKSHTKASQRGSTGARSSQASVRQLTPRQRTPYAMTPAPAEESDAHRILDEYDDEWNESKTTHPPEIFVHADLLADREGDRDNVWKPDRIWVHDQFVKGSKRDEICEFIESHGGEIVDKLREAETAIMPAWHSASYAELYNKVMSKGVFPVAYAWLVESAERSMKDGRPVRLSRINYAAPRPRPTDNRSKRNLRMSVDEKEQFARSYAAWLREEISRNEMLEQMQLKFFDGTRRTTIDGFDAILTENEKEIRSMARRVNASRLRHPLSEDDDQDGGFTTDAGDDAYDDFRRTRNRSHPPHSAGSVRNPTASATQSKVVDYLTRLSLAYAKSETLISSIFLACGFNTDWTERVLQIVKEFELRVADLTPDDRHYLDAAEAMRAEILNQDEVLWDPKIDAKIRRSKESALDDIAAELGLDLDRVKEREVHLQRTAEKGIRGWYPDEEGLRRLRDEAIDEAAGTDANGEGLDPFAESEDLEELDML